MVLCGGRCRRAAAAPAAASNSGRGPFADGRLTRTRTCDLLAVEADGAPVLKRLESRCPALVHDSTACRVRRSPVACIRIAAHRRAVYSRSAVRARLTTALTYARLQSALPKPLGIKLWSPDERVYSLLRFRTGREDVVCSREVVSALRRLSVPDGQCLVAAAGNFTREAGQLLEARSAILLARSDFGWTDESYQGIRSSK